MQYAQIEGVRREAESGLFGTCPVCSSAVIAKCGERRVRHWAHKGTRHCDHWWEPETEWHRAWKNKFPAEWQEIVHRAPDGEKHIADVKTAFGRVIEFQHSFIKPDERRSREAFYKPMIWVVNGLRRKRDRPGFCKALLGGSRINIELLTYRVPPDRCSILREWLDSNVPVFFDFGIAEDIVFFKVRVLWRLDPNSSSDAAFLTPVPLQKFIEALNKGEPVTGFRVKKVEITKRTLARSRPIPPWRPHRPPSGSPGFARYLARKQRSRRRFLSLRIASAKQ